MTDVNRRTLLGLAAAGSIGLPMMFGATSAFAASRGQWPGLDDSIVINGLGGVSNPNLRLEAFRRERDGEEKAIQDSSRRMIDDQSLREAKASGMTAVNLTLGYVAGDMEPFEYSVREVAAWDATIREHSDDLTKILTARDIEAAKADGKVGIIYGFQNCAQLGDNVERVDIFANLGVRIMQLTYNVANQLGDGSMAPDNRGLSDFGREAVARMNEQRVLIDLSHSGEQTCLDAIRASSVPISITHTGCRALADLPRNKTDEELRLLADRGGLAGIYFMPFLKVEDRPTAEDVVRHIEHAVNVCGEDNVGIGTDGPVTQIDDMELYKDALRAEVEARRAAGISAAGERPDTYPFILDLRGPDQFQKLAGMLHARGHKAARIEKILGGNFLRLMRDTWGV
ncbi:MAG: membrane dipeptidase [Sphingomonadales bacterium]